MLRLTSARLLVVPLAVLVGGLALAWPQAKPLDYIPPSGYVPDAVTAVAVGRAVLVPVYGKKTIAKEEPLFATLNGDVWTVSGDQHVPKKPFVSRDGNRIDLYLGGVAEVPSRRRRARSCGCCTASSA